MPKKQHQEKADKDKAKPPGRLYAGVVVWLACFLVGGLLLVEPVQGYKIGATVVPAQPLNQAKAGALAKRIEKCPKNSSGRPHQAVPVTAHVREVKGQQVIDLNLVATDQTRGQHELAELLRTLGHDLTENYDLANPTLDTPNAVISGSVTQQAEKIQSLVKDAEAAVAASQKTVAAAFDNLGKETATQVAALAPTTELEGPEVDPTESDLNRLRDQVGQLQKRFNELNQRLTPAHPDVFNAHRRLQEAQQRLDDEIRSSGRGARVYLSDGEINPPQTAQNLVNNQYVNDTANQSERFSQFVQWLYAEQKALKVKAENQVALTAKLEAISAQTNALLNSTALKKEVTHATTTAPLANPIKVIVEPHMVERLGGSMSLGRVLVLGLVASIIAIGVVYLLGFANQRKELFDAVESVQQLGVPILGVVSAKSAKVAPPTEKPSRIAPWTLRGCEFALGAMVILFVLYALTSSMETNSAIEDPVGTLAEMAWRMRSLVLKG